MITKKRNRPAEIFQAIEESLLKKAGKRISSLKESYLPTFKGMEELPDQKDYLTIDDLKRLARRVDRHSAVGTNHDETNDENGSESGRKKTLLQFDDEYNDDDGDYEDEEEDLEEKKLDPVGMADADIDNDGDVDDSDEYLKKRRKAIKKSMNENLSKFKNKSNSEIMRMYKKAKNGKDQKLEDDLVQEIEYRGLKESVDLKKIAKGKKAVTVELDDGEEFDLDPDTAQTLVDNASSNEIKKAMKNYESMMKLINKVLR